MEETSLGLELFNLFWSKNLISFLESKDVITNHFWNTYCECRSLLLSSRIFDRSFTLELRTHSTSSVATYLRNLEPSSESVLVDNARCIISEAFNLTFQHLDELFLGHYVLHL